METKMAERYGVFISKEMYRRVRQYCDENGLKTRFWVERALEAQLLQEEKTEKGGEQ